MIFIMHKALGFAVAVAALLGLVGLVFLAAKFSPKVLNRTLFQPTTTVTPSVVNRNIAVTPPVATLTLQLTLPPNKSIVTTTPITISGRTEPGAEVTINDLPDITADPNGNFSAAVNLDEGDNDIDVLAVNSQGDFAEKEVTVTYNLPANAQ